MDIPKKDMMQYGKMGMGLLKYGKKANKLVKLNKRIPRIGKKARLAKQKKKLRAALWNKRKALVGKILKRYGKKAQKAAKTSGAVSNWVWKRYFW